MGNSNEIFNFKKIRAQEGAGQKWFDVFSEPGIPHFARDLDVPNKIAIAFESNFRL